MTRLLSESESSLLPVWGEDTCTPSCHSATSFSGLWVFPPFPDLALCVCVCPRARTHMHTFTQLGPDWALPLPSETLHLAACVTHAGGRLTGSVYLFHLPLLS